MGVPRLATWHLGHQTSPARVVIPKDVDEVVAAVRDTKGCPSPLIAVGGMHSVTRCIEADQGTIVVMSAFDRVIGMAGAYDSEWQVVRAEAGVTMAALHAWLYARQREVSFSPEIGDATLGGLVTTMCKDSSVGGPGHLAALVQALTYVDHEGNVVRLSREDDEDGLEHYMCSYNTQGITLDVTLRCRPATLIRSRTRALPTHDGKRLAQRILKLRAACDNVWAVITLNGCLLEQRWALPGRPLHKQSLRPLLEVWRRVRYQSFLVSHTPAWVLLGARLPSPSLVHHRSLLVNSYPAVSAQQPRLDFSYYEYPDLARFEEIVDGALRFTRDHKDATGFAPAGFAVYFVRREGARARMAHGAYSGGEGWSFVMDPTCADPADPRWLEFCAALTPWALAHGARTSLTQTKELRAGQYALDSRYVRARFLTPYFAQFVTSVKDGAEVAARAPGSPVTALLTEFESAASASTSSE